jgi:hypothetical protein
MGLIGCPDCGKQVSDRATTCIGCGAPLGEKVAAIPSKEDMPSHASYDRKSKLFHGKTSQLVKLAIQAIQNLKWKVDSVNEGIGLVTFQTGISWGSWSGTVGSLHFNEASPNFFEVSGSGKQNLSGGQMVALNIGNEAQKRVDKVIATMIELAPSYIDPNAEPSMTLKELEARLKR